jgi:hypothetical protein
MSDNTLEAVMLSMSLIFTAFVFWVVFRKR